MGNKSGEMLSVAERLAILETEVESVKKYRYELDDEVDLNVFAAKDAKRGDLKKLVELACENAMEAKAKRGIGSPSVWVTVTMTDLNSAWNMVKGLYRPDRESQSSSKRRPRGT